jgi:hypothetical protein
MTFVTLEFCKIMKVCYSHLENGMQARKSYRKKTVFDELTPKATEILKIHVRTSLRQRIQAQFTEVEDSTGEV